MQVLDPRPMQELLRCHRDCSLTLPQEILTNSAILEVFLIEAIYPAAAIIKTSSNTAPLSATSKVLAATIGMHCAPSCWDWDSLGLEFGLWTKPLFHMRLMI